MAYNRQYRFNNLLKYRLGHYILLDFDKDKFIRVILIGKILPLIEAYFWSPTSFNV